MTSRASAKPSCKEQAEMTRRRLADTALRLFSCRGFDRVTVDEICREAGASKGAFYVHFASKDQVLVEDFISLDRFYLDSLEEIGGIEGGIERLAALGRYSLRHLSAQEMFRALRAVKEPGAIIDLPYRRRRERFGEVRF